MVCADVSFTTEGITIITGLLVAMGTTVVFLHRHLMAAKDAERERLLADREALVKQLEAKKKSYEQIAQEAVHALVEVADKQRAREGRPPVTPLASVVPESSSPSTPAQRDDAAIATLRARMAAVKVDQGLPPRLEPPQADDEPEVGRPVESVLLIKTVAGLTEATMDLKEATRDLADSADGLKDKIPQPVSPEGGAMNLDELKALAEKFRLVADNSNAVKKLANDTRKAHSGDHELGALLDRLTAAGDGDDVRAICDGVAARTV